MSDRSGLGFLRSFFLAALAGGVAALLLGATWHWLHADLGPTRPAEKSWQVCASLVAAGALLWLLVTTSFPQAPEAPETSSRSQTGKAADRAAIAFSFMTLVLALTVALAIPAVIIDLLLGPHGYKRAVQVSAFLVCLGAGFAARRRCRQRGISGMSGMGGTAGLVCGSLAAPAVLELFLTD
jgi:Na+/melibiose symporter-like transporter